MVAQARKWLLLRHYHGNQAGRFSGFTRRLDVAPGVPDADTSSVLVHHSARKRVSASPNFSHPAAVDTQVGGIGGWSFLLQSRKRPRVAHVSGPDNIQVLRGQFVLQASLIRRAEMFCSSASTETSTGGLSPTAARRPHARLRSCVFIYIGQPYLPEPPAPPPVSHGDRDGAADDKQPRQMSVLIHA